MIILSGKVIKGAQYGRVLGFPTANLDRRQYVRQKMNLKFGVYFGYANIPSKPVKTYKAGIVIGPLDTTGLPKIEAHLIGFQGNLYGQNVRLRLVKYLRPFKKYKNVEDLKKQINKDLQRIRG